VPSSVDLIFTKTPSLFTVALSALRGYRSGFDPAKPFPVITARRHGIKPEVGRLANFARVCSCDTGERLPLIYPLTDIYPVIQVMLARPEAPLSLTKMLNTRMEIIQYRPIGTQETCDLSCVFAAHRLVEKGLEVDIHCSLRTSGEKAWESTITFYYRGRFGQPAAAFQPPHLDDIPDAPEIARWFLPEGIGFAFARLSGDGNPLHYWKFYAKRFGFSRDFAQPLLVVAETLSRLEAKHPSGKYRLSIAFKGPVYYGRDVILKSAENTHSERFDIYSEGNPRPCISGNLRHG